MRKPRKKSTPELTEQELKFCLAALRAAVGWDPDNDLFEDYEDPDLPPLDGTEPISLRPIVLGRLLQAVAIIAGSGGNEFPQLNPDEKLIYPVELTPGIATRALALPKRGDVSRILDLFREQTIAHLFLS